MNKLEKQFNTDTGKNNLLDIRNGDIPRFTVLIDQITETTRWNINYRMVFKDEETDEIWETTYSEGATEMQDEAPFEYHDGRVFRVEPVEKTIIEYKRVTNK